MRLSITAEKGGNAVSWWQWNQTSIQMAGRNNVKRDWLRYTDYTDTGSANLDYDWQGDILHAFERHFRCNELYASSLTARDAKHYISDVISDMSVSPTMRKNGSEGENLSVATFVFA